MKRFLFIFISIFVLIVSLAPCRSLAVETTDGKDVIIERVIKIEGTVEKPRVIFIVPKAKLWSGNITDKRYRDEFLKPLYPISAAKREIPKEK